LALKEMQSTRKEEKINWGGGSYWILLYFLNFLWPFGPFPIHGLLCFLPPSSPMSHHCALICVTELFLIFPPFVFPSIPRPSGEPSSSKTFFQNLFRDSAVQGAVKPHLSGRWLSGSPNIRLGLVLRVKFSRILQN
jgi:fatty acid desaturase